MITTLVLAAALGQHQSVRTTDDVVLSAQELSTLAAVLNDVYEHEGTPYVIPANTAYWHILKRKGATQGAYQYYSTLRTWRTVPAATALELIAGNSIYECAKVGRLYDLAPDGSTVSVRLECSTLLSADALPALASVVQSVFEIAASSVYGLRIWKGVDDDGEPAFLARAQYTASLSDIELLQGDVSGNAQPLLD